MKGDATGQRFPEIDVLKSVAILTVILIHSLRAPWDPRISAPELWLGIVTRFAVPGFLFCSGFLYSTSTPIDGRTVVRRLRRVLVPYLICSIGAQLWWLGIGQAHTPGEIVFEMLLGSSFGPYYYVFVHFFLVLVAPVFAFLPGRALIGLTIVFVAGQAWLECNTSLFLPIFWHIRNPLLWWGYFLLGWLARRHHAAIRDWIVARRRLLMACFAMLVVLLTWASQIESRTEWVRAAMWLDIYAIVAFILVATCGRRRVPASISALSDASFAIYLLHLYFVYAAERIVTPAVNVFDVWVIGGYWSAGLLGSLGVIALARRALGRRSRDVIGA